ncbi:hypothetical protein DQ04_01431080 [Trypanosoma grayi]|uniref:hypothetical protein n=1 Tax=Trypanosoma grayi TaxID=71804 RepID=UPI0004F4BA39|nr:hypothetical protein DQ04_01431080 [Trypanosoma grayi]KEG12779.1 hypothetical protein DQ04_01431080 [Trypanosoma grayi]
MSEDIRRQLLQLLLYVKEGEALFDASSNQNDDADEEEEEGVMTPCVDESKPLGIRAPDLTAASCASAPHAASSTERVLRIGRDTHEKARRALREAAASPAFSFAVLRR